MSSSFILRVSVPDNTILSNDALFNASSIPYTIDWGDGSSTSTASYDTLIEKTYISAGTYDIAVSFGNNNDVIYFRPTMNDNGIQNFLTDVIQWPENPFNCLVFQFCKVLVSLPQVSPILAPGCYIDGFLSECVNFNSPIVLNTSEITSFYMMFSGASSFNQSLSFDTSNVTNMASMFSGASSFNQSLSFDTSNVTNMSSMFLNASLFNQSLSSFDTHNVTNMSGMFSGASSFNQSLSFDTSNVTNMSGMFSNATSFNQPLSFITSNVSDMSNMFSGANSFNQPISFDTQNVTNMYAMFCVLPLFDSPISFSNTSLVTNMSFMFSDLPLFNQQLDFDTSNVTDMNSMFRYDELYNKPINFITSNVIDMSSMFLGCNSFNQVLSFDTSNVINMGTMLSHAFDYNQETSFNTSKVTNMKEMFYRCRSFNFPLPFDTSSVTNMDYMLYEAEAFNQKLDNFDVRNVESMNAMLANCKMSTANYDLTLAGWAAQTVKPNVSLGASSLIYSDITSREILTNPPNNWYITGDSTGNDDNNGGGNEGGSDDSFKISKFSIQALLTCKDKSVNKSMVGEKADIDACRSFFFSIIGDIIKNSGYPEYQSPEYIDQLFYNPSNGDHQLSLEDHVGYFAMLNQSPDEVFINRVRLSLQSCFVFIVIILRKMYFLENQNMNNSQLSSDVSQSDQNACSFEIFNRKVNFKVTFLQ